MQEVIALVPGFAASHLYRRDLGGDREEQIWLSQLDIAWSGVLELDTDPAVSPPDLARVRAAGILADVYQPFLAHCRMWGIEVLWCAYDWRTDVATNGQRLASVLDDYARDDVRITIVAHSMGGLVAASALNRIADPTVSKIRRLITCGTPWRGSYRTLQLFSGHHDIVEKIVDLNKVLSRRSRQEWVRETTRVVASWPGAYDLLPMPDMMAEYPPGPGQDFRVDPWLGVANNFFSTVKYNEAVARRPIHVGFPDSIQHYNFRGTGRRTVGPSPTVLDGTLGHYFTSLFGDTATPEASSRAPLPFNAITSDFDVDHEQFCNDWRVVHAIGRIMGVLN